MIALSLLTQFLLIALVATAIVLGGTIGYLYLKARNAEKPEELSQAEREELRRRDLELKRIRARIDEIYYRQQQGSETQHAIVQQQMEELNRQIDARARQVEGLQGQMRYEIEQRQAAMAEMKGQIAELVDAVRTMHLTAASSRQIGAPAAGTQPPHHASAETPPEPPAQKRAGASSPEEQPAPPSRPAVESAFDWSPIDLDTQDEETGDSLLDLFDDEKRAETVPQHHYAVETELEETIDQAEIPAPTDAEQDDEGIVWNLRSDEPEASETDPGPDAEELLSKSDDPFALPDVPREQWKQPAEEQPAPHAVPEASGDSLEDVVRWTSLDFAEEEEPADGHEADPFEFFSLDVSGGDGLARSGERPAAATAIAPEPEASVEPVAPAHIPAGAEDLTTLPMIDVQRQQALYQMGVCRIEEIASFTRAQAREVGSKLGVSEEAIMTDWIFAAQSLLFERYQQELRQRPGRP